MAKKMTMHQELDMLRKEVEEFRKQKEAQEKNERAEALKVEKVQAEEMKKGKEKAKEILESVGKAKTDAKEGIHELLDSIKKDYENLSPVAAVVLFALGAAFGRALEKD
jgi:glucosamine 6-phosphate synthetase-like amidotransferase/phosphosugar isomerase protein